MSHTSEAVAPQTVFERIWKRESHLFKSERHRLMAFADDFPRMPLQVVVAPADGEPGQEVHFNDLELRRQRQILEVGLAVGAKILEHCAPGQRSMFNLEGFAVKDHAHIVYYAGERGQGINRFTGQTLGQEAVQQTIEAITFTPVERELLEARLDLVAAD